MLSPGGILTAMGEREEVEVRVTECEVMNNSGHLVDGLRVECKRCGKVVEVFGVSDRSFRRACAEMNEDCDAGEDNFYIDEDGNYR